mmetsp:Transcript_12128/g.16523  ORF Transcript_12128/g.16523 Transcript_12128/m.16523 type:complete len:413 (-) Transcript_12128:339-1577(-)|eukprot:CAMPEP_0196579716 /NCGR_PEP_ID=MMETSP1081-20130531/24466_1 /TAXON_ID=36882 /ORGANISM="Pyramimonas amylifera, Strain CCMP720" /LENGTH=412 /DNA_ID=CAMNT_0041899379 /DNA_START=68 /DNA_END=1306 /DNA_ORIENTATION=-
MNGNAMLVLFAVLSLAASASAKVFFEEKFDSEWESRWTKSTFKQDEGTAGEFTLTAGKWYGDEADKGIQTGPDARFFAISSEMEEFSNEGIPLVLQFSAKHEQKLDCGGGYIKLLPASSDMSNFGGDTPYSIMFGPDICGSSTKKVHVIFTYKGKNLLTKKSIQCETDELTHVYTLILNPDKTYKVLIDNVEKAAGHLEDDWDFLAPKYITDPEAVRPEDWDERPVIDDPEDVKPDGYDEIPAKIADPEAEKPEDWDDEDDGEWEAPMLDNPEFKGEWAPKKMDNPMYKGKWEAPKIDNPEYESDDKIHVFKDLKYVGFELWQVKAGSIFDNILVTDDVEYAAKFAEDTWGAMKEGEKTMYDAAAEATRLVEEEERKKAEEERKALEEEEDSEEEEEEEEETEKEEEDHDEL